MKVSYGPPPSNKPPPPDPTPKQSHYPWVVNLGDIGEVWVSIPKPDRLTIVGDVYPAHFAAGYTPSGSSYAQIIMMAAASGELGKVVGKPSYANGLFSMVQIIAPGGGAINFTRLKTSAEGATDKLRIELNPWELGADGALTLLDRLHSETGGAFKVGHFLADARVSRVDVAIDLVGVRVADILVSSKGEGKRTHYYGQTGELESVYLFRKFKPHDVDQIEPTKVVKRKGLGSFLVRVYDKVEERRSVGRQPPFGPAPVTRVEISKTRFGAQVFGLRDLAEMKNPFAKLRVGHARSPHVTNLWEWLQYVQCRRGSGPVMAAELLTLNLAKQIQYGELWKEFPSDLVTPPKIWGHWKHSLVASGVQHFVDAATMFSSGSVVGDYETAMKKKTGHDLP